MRHRVRITPKGVLQVTSYITVAASLYAEYKGNDLAAIREMGWAILIYLWSVE